MSKSMFFNPYIGNLYKKDGLLGKRVLVVGASFYCKEKRCPFYSSCTNPLKKDSSKFDNLCPAYNASLLSNSFNRDTITKTLKNTAYNKITKLSDCPTEELASGGIAYKKFGNALSKHLFKGCKKWNEIWDYLAFTNYVQFIIPTCTTKTSYISDRDYNAFISAIDETEADIVIVWGTVINKPIVAHAKDFSLLKQSKSYMFQIEHKEKIIIVLNPYHPASGWFYNKDSQNFFLSYLRRY
jgi:hypothetical protein